jgi:hypothetical protein
MSERNPNTAHIKPPPANTRLEVLMNALVKIAAGGNTEFVDPPHERMLSRLEMAQIATDAINNVRGLIPERGEPIRGDT